MQKVGDVVCTILFLATCIFSLTIPEISAILVKDAIALCSKTLIPALFPYLVVTQLFSRTGLAERAGNTLAFVLAPLLSIPKSLCGAFLVGVFGGFPNGAHAAGIAYKAGKCTKNEAERLVGISNNCSVTFIVAIAAGTVSGENKSAFLLIFSELFCILIIAQILRFCYPDKEKQYFPKKSASKQGFNSAQAVCLSIKTATYSMLGICGYVTVFYMLAEYVFYFIPYIFANNSLGAMIRGILEMSIGVLSCGKISFPLNYIVCSAILGFSGLSVVCQVSDVCTEYGLSANPFIFSRIVGAVCMPVCTTCLLLFLPRRVVPVFLNTSNTPLNQSTSLLGIILVYATIFTAAIFILNGIFCIKKRIWKKL